MSMGLQISGRSVFIETTISPPVSVRSERRDTERVEFCYDWGWRVRSYIPRTFDSETGVLFTLRLVWCFSYWKISEKSFHSSVPFDDGNFHISTTMSLSVESYLLWVSSVETPLGTTPSFWTGYWLFNDLQVAPVRSFYFCPTLSRQSPFGVVKTLKMEVLGSYEVLFLPSF